MQTTHLQSQIACFFDGVAAIATVIPIFLDFTSEDDERFLVKKLIATALTHVNENVRHAAAEGIREYLWSRDDKFAQNCINGVLAYARFKQNTQFENRQNSYLEGNLEEHEKYLQHQDNFREQFVQGQFISNDLEKITLQTHNLQYILSPSFMIPDGSTEPDHISLLTDLLTIFFEAEQKENDYQNKDEYLKIHLGIRFKFTGRFAKYLFSLYELGFGYESYIDYLLRGCEKAPGFMSYLIPCFEEVAEKTNKMDVYWKIWKALSPKVQEIAIAIAFDNSKLTQNSDTTHHLIRTMLKADFDWQKIDLENQDIRFKGGKVLIFEFVKNTGKNPTVFGALAKLMYYFPAIFFEQGIHILAKFQQKEDEIRLLANPNTPFYLEQAIKRFLHVTQTGALSKQIHKSCFILLDALVETASSRAYYLREHLIKSRKMI
ncbi:conserved hypothetical protein [Beggiatoa sp. PS]|nr:conserved hypothetical protein [Beggiatoa sp. PS]